jgi:integrase
MEYANVYDKGRQNWWIWFKDPATGRRRYAPTPYRKDDPTGKRKALAMAREHSQDAVAVRGSTNHERWDAWVPGFLETTFGYNEHTLTRYQNAWTAVATFLDEQKLWTPRHVERRHAAEFLVWRKSQKRHCGKSINHNTALTDLRVWTRIMREALDRGYLDANPLYQLGFKRVNVKVKPELTDAEIAKIRATLAENNYPEWMMISFEIALHQGCRLTETQVPIGDIDFENGEITFRMKGRGGQPEIHTAPIHPDLRPLLEKIHDRGDPVTCVLPQMAAKIWWQFRQKHGLGHTAFHSTRVSVATRFARAGVSQTQAMAYLNHASETVHRVYLRLRAKDTAAAATRALQYGAKRETLGTPDARQPTSRNAA